MRTPSQTPTGRIDTLELSSGSFVDEALRERHTDLLYAVRVRGRGAFIFAVLEHRSSVDLLMPPRVLVYVTRVWERWLRDHDGARRLTAVVPVVVHHSETGWTSARSLLEIIDLEPELQAAARCHLGRGRRRERQGGLRDAR